MSPEIGPATAQKLLQTFGFPSAIFDASEEDLRQAGFLRESQIQSLISSRTHDLAEREAQRAKENAIRVVPRDSPEFPINLSLLPNPPLVLYVRGILTPEDRIAVAVVGPRKPSDYARLMTSTLVPPLCARGAAIVSGLAYGIDAEAHLAAINCGGRTLAVLGQGLDTPVYPAANKKLADRIVNENRGALISVFPLGTKPDPGLFPVRNEIIAGLSLGTLVVEAGEESGALITARHTLELNRAVMACPGDATRKTARGSNRLIADGAVLVQKSDDVLRALEREMRDALAGLGPGDSVSSAGDENSAGSHDSSIRPSKQTLPRPIPSDTLERLIGELLTEEHRSIDFLLDHCAEAGHTNGEVIQKLLKLEMAGLIRQLPGRIFAWVE